ncbi:uncharacterized protein C2845_PM15G12930 [Panicum miliaceum]|uniref:Uncharacterized protein n=1 Tax=Panicum miliaceum TaxID=4540 RepID=A0A3L6Q677_PANMI|nr:uncharacterized protein C2845_PM15G12930 [Panicum miliaceum]
MTTAGRSRCVALFVLVAMAARAAAAAVVSDVCSNYHMKPDGTLCGPVVDDVSLVPVHRQAARRRLRM